MLKVGILGAGFMGVTHARAFAKQTDLQIVAISSRSAGKARDLAEQYGAEPCADAMHVATDPRVDVVSNTLPSHLHREFTIAALKAGKHVLLEKPMGLSVAECDELIAVAKQTKRLLMIGHTVRFWPEYTVLVGLVKSGQLGKPLGAIARRLAGPPRWAEWFLHPEWSGGEVLDLQIHDVDSFNWLFGVPKTVYARGQRAADSGGWDLALTLIDYGGPNAFAEGSAMQPPEYPFTATLSVLCERGSVEFSFRAGGAQVDSRDSGGTSLMLYEAGKPPRALESPGGDAYDREIAAFVSGVRSGRMPEDGTPEQGRLAVATSLAARRSIETGEVVKL